MTSAPPVRLNKDARRRLATLERRAAWLEQRAETLDDPSYDRAELKALRWAIETIRAAGQPTTTESPIDAGLLAAALHEWGCISPTTAKPKHHSTGDRVDRLNANDLAAVYERLQASRP